MTRMHFYLLFLYLLLILLTGCNIPGRPASTPSPDELPVDSSPELIIPVEGTASPTIPPNASRDPCLEGTWIMPADVLDLLAVSVIPEATSFLSIPSGQLKLTFTDTAFTYSGDYIMHVNEPDGSWAEVHNLFKNSGSYTTDMHMLIFDTQVSESQTFDCKGGSSDGQVFSMPCNFPVVTILPASRAPYTCNQNRLEVQTMSPRGPMTMFFER